MSNELIAFGYSENDLRTTIDENDNIWFVAKDVCEILGITWNGKTLKNLPKEWRGTRSFSTPQKNQHSESGEAENKLVIINESGFYRLVFRSNKPEAIRFTNWVAGEVLPSLRKTGMYATNDDFMKQMKFSIEIDVKIKHIASYAWALYKTIEAEVDVDIKQELAFKMLNDLRTKCDGLDAFLFAKYQMLFLQ